MGGSPCIPVRRSNREAAGLEGGETLEVRLDLDGTREVTPPADFSRALKSTPPAWRRWSELSYSHQREYAESIEAAKKPETRARRIEAAVRAIRGTALTADNFETHFGPAQPRCSPFKAKTRVRIPLGTYPF